MGGLPFDSIYRHGFARVAVCIPFVRLGNPDENAIHTIVSARHADATHAAIAIFPELGLSGYSNEDLFHQDGFLEATRAALGRVANASRGLAPLIIVGAPLKIEQKLFNCAIAIHRGRILGVTPKTYLPNYREFYERRQFTPGTHALSREVGLLGATVPFGNDVLYEIPTIPDCVVHVEICEDMWVPVPPSESVLGPFALHDFFLYYVSRFGHRPSRVVFLAEHAWRDRHVGAWPDETASAERPEYDRATIKHWLGVFLRRFFETSQFKRSAVPNAPKVGSGGSLSPRSDWRAPSDGHADAWLQELEHGVPD